MVYYRFFAFMETKKNNLRKALTCGEFVYLQFSRVNNSSSNGMWLEMKSLHSLKDNYIKSIIIQFAKISFTGFAFEDLF